MQTFESHSLNISFWKEDGWYLAECLDIPGCMSQGRTERDVRANIADAINSCLSVIVEDQLKLLKHDNGNSEGRTRRMVEIQLPHVEAENIPTLNGAI